FFFSSRRRHTRFSRDWSSDVCSSDLDEKNFFITKKYNLTVEDFVELPQVYKFIEKYVRENKGAIPDYRTVQAEFEEFEYMPEVRSEERRVGKEGRSRWSRDAEQKHED